jgi:hypothetical protein
LHFGRQGVWTGSRQSLMTMEAHQANVNDANAVADPEAKPDSQQDSAVMLFSSSLRFG